MTNFLDSIKGAFQSNQNKSVFIYAGIVLLILSVALFLVKPKKKIIFNDSKTEPGNEKVNFEEK